MTTRHSSPRRLTEDVLSHSLAREVGAAGAARHAAESRQFKPGGLAQAASHATKSAGRVLWHAVSSLGVWFLPITVGALVAAAVTGSLTLHRGAGTPSDQDKVVLAERPFMAVNLYYPQCYIEIVQRARRDGRDILASFGTLQSAWNAASPDAPLAIKLVTSSLPEPITGKVVSPVLAASAVIDEASFQEMLPLLEDIRQLILQGDGSGRGQLSHSGYAAEPAGPGTRLLGPM